MSRAGIPAGAVVVGYDGSPDADAALDWAADQAALDRRPLVVIHSHSSFVTSGTLAVEYAYLLETSRVEAERLLAAAADRVRATYPDIAPTLVESQGDAREDLVDASTRAAMVVVGCRGHGPVARLFLGSVSGTASRHAACPVVIVHAGERAPRGAILAAVDGSSASGSVVEFAFRQAELTRRSVRVVHVFHDLTAAAGGARAGGRGLADESATVDLMVVGHLHPGGWLDRFQGSVVLPVLGRTGCPIAVVRTRAVADRPRGSRCQRRRAETRSRRSRRRIGLVM